MKPRYLQMMLWANSLERAKGWRKQATGAKLGSINRSTYVSMAREWVDIAREERLNRVKI
jgi:hypothetical protein